MSLKSFGPSAPLIFGASFRLAEPAVGETPLLSGWPCTGSGRGAPWRRYVADFPLLNPNARIRLCKFVRSIPRARAAPDTFQLASSSARRI